MTTADWMEHGNVTMAASDASVPNLTSLIVRAVTLLSIGMLALVGNCLVIVVVLRYKKLRKPTNVFVCNLSLACFVLGVDISISTGNLIRNRNVLGYVGCQTWGMTAMISYGVVAMSLALISLSRLVLIRHPQRFRRIFSIRICVTFSASAWIAGVLFSLGAVTDWGEIVYNPKTKACSYSRAVGLSFHYFLLSALFAIPLIASIVSYSLLYVTVKQSASRVQAAPRRISAPSAGSANAAELTTAAARDQNSTLIRKKDWKLTRMLIITFVLFLVSIGPYTLVNIIDGSSRIPETVHLTVSWFLYSNAAINPFIYGLMNKSFRNAYSSVCKKKADQSLFSRTQIFTLPD